MFKLDDNLLRELGLGSLPPQEKNRMLAHIYETLEMRVGMKLAQGMSDDQLREFEQLMPLETDTPEMKKDKEQQALKWLETNFPDYKKVVAEELENLKTEIKQAAPQILASSQQQSSPHQPQSVTDQQSQAQGQTNPSAQPVSDNKQQYQQPQPGPQSPQPPGQPQPPQQ